MKLKEKKSRAAKIIPVIVGPTASGKTALAVKAALNLDAEIISCDSRQIYKFMDIGTAKPSAAQLAAVKHHLIDIITPDRSFSHAEFAALAAGTIKDILGRGRLPIIVGGTGFYLDGLINGISQIPELDQEEARRMRGELELRETAFLVSELRKLDMESASRIKFNDRQRLVRAIIVSRLSGAPFSSYKDVREKNNDYNYLIFGLTKSRELLYNNINSRVEQMFDDGLADEVSSLLKMGYCRLMPGMKSIGYQECIEYLNGTLTFAEAAERVKQNTRNYAKRQLTYFKKFEFYKWFEKDDISVDDSSVYEAVMDDISKNI